MRREWNTYKVKSTYKKRFCARTALHSASEDPATGLSLDEVERTGACPCRPRALHFCFPFCTTVTQIAVRRGVSVASRHTSPDSTLGPKPIRRGMKGRGLKERLARRAAGGATRQVRQKLLDGGAGIAQVADVRAVGEHVDFGAG